MTGLLAGWSRTRSMIGVGPAAGQKIAVTTGTAPAVDDSDRSVALCGAVIVAVRPAMAARTRRTVRPLRAAGAGAGTLVALTHRGPGQHDDGPGILGQVSSRIVAVLTLLGLVMSILLAVRLLPVEAMLISGR
jgi:hypothetical protein